MNTTDSITYDFKANVFEHGSWGASRPTGPCACQMIWHEGDSAGNATIEFIVDEPGKFEGYEEIGLTFCWKDGKRHLVEYDGVIALPSQVMLILVDQGVTIDKEDYEEGCAEALLLEGDEIPRRIA